MIWSCSAPGIKRRLNEIGIGGCLYSDTQD